MALTYDTQPDEVWRWPPPSPPPLDFDRLNQILAQNRQDILGQGLANRAWRDYRAGERDTVLSGDQSGMAGTPAKPPTLPQVTPVDALKNATALQQGYSPAATQALGQTPVMAGYGSPDQDLRKVDPYAPPPLAESDTLGAYIPSPLRRWQADADIYLNAPLPDVLGHEFAHAWYNQRMPGYLQREYNSAVTLPDYDQSWVPPGVQQHIRSFPEVYGPQSIGPETYAYSAEAGAQGIPQAVQDRYYAGLYKTAQPEWQGRTDYPEWPTVREPWWQAAWQTLTGPIWR